MVPALRANDEVSLHRAFLVGLAQPVWSRPASMSLTRRRSFHRRFQAR